MSQTSSPYRALWWRLVQIGCTVALVVILWRSIDWATFQVALTDLRWSFVFLAAFLLLIAHGINVVRWSGLLLPSRVPLMNLTACYGAGLFSNNFLPTGVGGDAIRAALVTPHVGWSRALLSVALDRGIGLLGLSLFIIPGLWLGLPETIVERVAQDVWELMNRPFIVITSVIVAATIGGGLVYRYASRIREPLLRLLQGQIADPAVRWSRQEWFGALFKAFTLSVLSNLSTIAAHWAMLEALNITISPGAAIWLVIMSAVSMLIPLSINSLGLVESVFVIVLMAYDVPPEPALAVALLSRIFLIFYSLLGGALSLRLRWWDTSVAKPTG